MQPGDKLTIETPEQTTLEFPLAGIGSRGLAIAIDTLIQISASVVLLIVAGLVSWAGYLPQFGKLWVFALYTIAGFLVEIAYFAFFEIIWNGQTPGKRWTHLRVIRDSGRPVDVQSAILRNLFRIVDTLPALYALGIVTSLISAQNKRLGDLVAGTVVVHEKALQRGTLWDAPATSPLAMAQPNELTVPQLELVEAFLERRAAFPEEVRRSMALQIAGRVSQGMSIPAGTLQEPEKFLEALAEQRRNMARFR